MESFLSILGNLSLFVAIICGLAGSVGFVWRIGATEDTYDRAGVFVAINVLLFAGFTVCAALVFLLLFTPLRDHLNQAVIDSLLKIGSACAVINGVICGLLGVVGFIGRIIKGGNPDKDTLSYRIIVRLFVGGLTGFGISTAALMLPQLNVALSKGIVDAWFPFFSHEVLFVGIVCGLFGIVGFGRSIIGDLDVDGREYGNIWILFLGGLLLMVISMFSLSLTSMFDFLNNGVKTAVLPVLGFASMVAGCTCGILTLVGLCWRILAGGSYVLQSEFRRMLGFLLGGLLVFLASIAIVWGTPVKDYLFAEKGALETKKDTR